ncbi:MAG: methyltransferase [Planctomycetaceae bacterium]|jgi:16S rRNA (guanine1207-N2)-methyltransferase
MASRKRREQQQLEWEQLRQQRGPEPEQLLIEALAGLPARPFTSVLSTSLGRGQAVAAAVRQLAPARADCHFLDLYRCRETAREFAESLPTLHCECASDLPEQPVDLALLPVDPRGEAELTRDWLQQMHQRLRPGGLLLAATSNPDDQWLHAEIRRLFGKTTRTPRRKGVWYQAVKGELHDKYKNFDCEFAFRDQGELLQVFSRPGVFSHRSLDAGARTLIESLDLKPGSRVVDLGCGSGAVALAAARRCPGGQVLALDSNPRAIECTLRGIAANGMTGVQAVLDDQGEAGERGTYDVVAGNPPYFSEYKIAELFLRTARRLLKPGGQVLMVTKTPAWFEEQMPRMFDVVESRLHRTYHVVTGVQRSTAAG